MSKHNFNLENVLNYCWEAKNTYFEKKTECFLKSRYLANNKTTFKSK